MELGNKHNRNRGKHTTNIKSDTNIKFTVLIILIPIAYYLPIPILLKAVIEIVLIHILNKIAMNTDIDSIEWINKAEVIAIKLFTLSAVVSAIAFIFINITQYKEVTSLFNERIPNSLFKYNSVGIKHLLLWIDIIKESISKGIEFIGTIIEFIKDIQKNPADTIDKIDITSKDIKLIYGTIRGIKKSIISMKITGMFYILVPLRLYYAYKIKK